MGDNFEKQDVIDVWKAFSIADAIIAVDKATRAIKPETVITCWRKLCPDAAPGSAPPEAEPIKEVVEEIVSSGKKLGGEGFDDMDVRDIEELIDSAPEELTEDDLLEMTGPEMLPGDEDEDLEEAVPENKLTLENLAKGFWLFRSAVDFFYDMDPSLLRPLKLKQLVEEGLLPYKNIFNEMKRQRRQTEITMYSGTSKVDRNLTS
ncbi:hypothetical protein M514_13302 [Trichuris suis]|nr:hypothetical protein M514_13302 [Trichuris suis]